MDVLYYTIIAIIVGAIFRTVWAFGWKIYKEQTTKFNVIYLYTTLLSMAFSIAFAPALIFSGLLKFAVLGQPSLGFLMFAFFCVGYFFNSILNKPVSLIISIVQNYQATLKTTKVALPQVSSDLRRKLIIAGVIALLIGLVAASSVYAYTVYQASIHTTGTIEAYGVKVYSDSEGTVEVTNVNWGLLAPGESKDMTLYIKDTGNTPITLNIWTQNWLPLNAQTSLTFTTDYPTGTVINPNALLAVKMTLKADPLISGITDFSYTVVITAPPVPHT